MDGDIEATFRAICRDCETEFLAETPQELRGYLIIHHREKEPTVLAGLCGIFYVRQNDGGGSAVRNFFLESSMGELFIPFVGTYWPEREISGHKERK